MGELEHIITHKTKNLLKEYRKRLRPAFYFQKTSDRYTSGIPDFYILYRGFSAHIELKREGEDAGVLQSHVLYSLQRAGARILCTDDFKEVRDFLKALTAERSQ